MSLSAIRGKLNWQGVLKALNYNETTWTLPHKITCYFCSNVMTIYPDIQFNAWAHCASCHFSGDLLELARATWRLDTLTTMKKLMVCEAYVPREDIAEEGAKFYDENILNKRTHIKDIYKQCIEESTFVDFRFQTLNDALNLQPAYDSKRWKRQLGSQICHVSYKQFKQFKLDSKYTEYIALPCHEAPGKVIGFVLIYASGRPEETIFRSASLFQNYKEAGLPFFDFLPRYDPIFRKAAFIFFDPKLVLYLHNRQFKDSSFPLPVSYAYCKDDVKPNSVYDVLTKKDLVFCDQKPTKYLFSQAARANGRVVIQPYEINDISNYKVFLHSLNKNALKWDKALDQEMTRLSDSELETILLNLDLPDNEWQTYLENRTPEIRERIVDLTKKDYPSRKIYVFRGNGAELVDNENGWYVDGKLVTDARFFIDYLWIEDSKIHVYGKIYHRGKIYKLETLEHELKIIRLSSACVCHYAETITKTIAAQGGEPPLFDPFWIDKFYEISKLLSRPRKFLTRPEVEKLQNTHIESVRDGAKKDRVFSL